MFQEQKEGLCSWHIVISGNKIREKAGGEAELQPGRVLCTIEFDFIPTVMNTHWRILSRVTMGSDSHVKASLLLFCGLSVTGWQERNQKEQLGCPFRDVGKKGWWLEGGWGSGGGTNKQIRGLF